MKYDSKRGHGDKKAPRAHNKRGSRPASSKHGPETDAANRAADHRQPPARLRAAAQQGAPDPARAVRASGERIALFGFHAVREALRARKRQLLDIFATKAAADKLAADIEAAGLTVHCVEAPYLSRRLGAGAVHQGVLLEARPLEPLDLSDIIARSGVVVVLDQITDPHNVGAILRNAAAFGVDALVMTDRHAPELTGVVAKAASGGLEHVAIIHVANLARALQRLDAMGYLRVGLDSGGAAELGVMPLTRPLALVLGGEGGGMRRLTRENCDIVARLDMPGPIKSLNVANACAVALTLVRLRLAD